MTSFLFLAPWAQWPLVSIWLRAVKVLHCDSLTNKACK